MRLIATRANHEPLRANTPSRSEMQAEVPVKTKPVNEAEIARRVEEAATWLENTCQHWSVRMRTDHG
ncbi:hypothetical protein TC41_1126 [Alicyclobacillus acidocaldarius subsp. acidocaldarius Tc-4-1]|uniref:Uncharacterized protein n=1 Tax=Alicyclobacillus acidocaldarius (strain Tc-4-1) TaxID=1048834 RepID=F8IGQ9_ALIAT|nr:hypothetical protein TC41_1126 [Alicyclobacillus acidocaldarius subsp. acidocaldarius Tc-4-1]